MRSIMYFNNFVPDIFTAITDFVIRYPYVKLDRLSNRNDYFPCQHVNVQACCANLDFKI